MKKFISNTANEILAGLMIAIGCGAFLASENKVVGAILFSIALITICFFKFALFTGKIGFLIENHTKDDFSIVLTSILGNLIGTFLFGLLIRFAFTNLEDKAFILCNNKLEIELWKILIRALFCGVLMYVAVYIFINAKSSIGIVFAIPVFILSGYEHSIADMGYFAISGIFSFESFLFIVVVIFGNAIGSFIIPLLTKLKK